MNFHPSGREIILSKSFIFFHLGNFFKRKRGTVLWANDIYLKFSLSFLVPLGGALDS